MCLLQPSVSTLPAGYHLPWLTTISQVCKTELLYLAQESCSISSYHLKTKISPGNTCSQHHVAGIWNSIRAREPVQLALTDANAQCGQLAAGWEPCFTLEHFSPLFSTILLRCGGGRQYQQSAKVHLSTPSKTSGHRNQQHILGFGKNWCPTKPQLCGDQFPASAKQVSRYISPFSVIYQQCTKTSASLQSYS